jgi:hypothetical protein
MSGFNEHPGQTNRSASSAFLLVDSADRLQVSELNSQGVFSATALQTQQPLNNFIIQKRQPFITGFFNRLAVTECRFEFNSPNVNPRNNQIKIAQGVSTYTLTVPTGFYTPVELALELTDILNNTVSVQTQWPGLTWTVTYQNNPPGNGLFTIANDGVPAAAGAVFTLYPAEYPTVAQTLKGLYFMMGFNYANTEAAITAGKSAFYPANNTQVASMFPSMAYTRYVDVCSRQLTQYQKVKDSSTRENQTPAVLLRIYLGNYTVEGVGEGDASATETWPGCRPCVIQRIMNVPKYSSWSPGQFIDQIDIQLRDDVGNLLYMFSPVRLPSPNTPGTAGYISPQDLELFGAIQTNNTLQMTLHASES